LADTYRPAAMMALLALALSGQLRAEERTASQIVNDEVAACTSRAMEGTLDPTEWLDWVSPCQQRTADLCALHPIVGDLPNDCDTHIRAAWKASADLIKSRLIRRWQDCAVPETVKAELIQSIEATDAAVLALFDANCGYDAEQWRAFGQTDIAATRNARCIAEAEAARAMVHFQNYVRDAGCDAGGTP
jgi:hypothetical protein